ncbi:ImmA/IrrE family metallo-endopeptidase [Fictibacillus enclensis]|uniref:ImmA/IrrE family metallo-endopeptidase n=1 Tax=Fictibacillus enclensis TaxID=1017270 RepID=UPI0024BF2129|nr:ImmA/IrrE family metallo-endopeptidase [Fictibacillus enclensis]WHY71259.1 ArdC-like ssDNA-binding domain-containing protein [Fictibacillus enclensis]
MANKNYKSKTFKEKQQEINDLTNVLHDKVNSYFETPSQLKEYLEYKSRFYQYSSRNMALIDHQFPGALAVGNFGFWKKHGFTVNKGEKGIKILKPNPFNYFRRDGRDEKIPVAKATAEEKQKIRHKEIPVFTDRYYSLTYVFDVSQTNATAKDLPDIFPNRWLEGKVENYSLVYQSLEKVADKYGINIVDPYEELGAAKGVSYTQLKEVALNPRNSELQNVKTLIHELAHATLHTKETRSNYNHHEKEFQAELTAFTVASYLGLDTSEYSLGYISHFSKDETKFDDKIRLLDEVVKTSHAFIEVIEEDLVENRKASAKDRNELMALIEWSEAEGLQPKAVLSLKKMNDYLLAVNRELRTATHEMMEIETKYTVTDSEGNRYEPKPFVMSKDEDEQPFSSLLEQLQIQEPDLYRKMTENFESKSALENKFMNYQLSLRKESAGDLSEEAVLERLDFENDYYESKSNLLKSGAVSSEEVRNLEEKVKDSIRNDRQPVKQTNQKAFHHEEGLRR